MRNQSIEGLETIVDAAAKTSQNYFSLQRAIRRGEVPAVKLPGGRVGVRLEDARAFAQTVSK